ncbi:MAG TPA: arginase [Elusimicrobia bacterium]|nr:MAG: arginase [Elusimicrobia bacterium GWA2_66_18]OGR69902.1 MAG: arginase [Elusimicrobia bacterium GWC2_65_9]HAZ09414.1 arginase [Elusimicrobiota bacterium]
MLDFDPNAAPDAGSGVFGLPHKEKDAALVLLPVPWEATTSYGGGASRGPAAILAASGQIDLFDGDVIKPYEPGIFMRPQSKEVRSWDRAAKTAAQKVIKAGGMVTDRPALQKALQTANDLGGRLNDWVGRETKSLLDAGKIVGLVGGDHSTPYGAYQAAADKYGNFGLLHFDAHSDARVAYEGLVWSHASIMYNALENIPQITRIVQVGVRDYCEQEHEFLHALGQRAKVFHDRDIAAARFEGRSWTAIATAIADMLPDKVWVSFDIDGLDPKLCPHTGTPVPGGLEFSQVSHLLGLLARSGRTILGFDLVEVAPAPSGRDEWDANVGMRLLYKLAAWTFVSRGYCKPRA